MPLADAAQALVAAGRGGDALRLLDRSPLLSSDDSALRLFASLAVASGQASAAMRRVAEATHRRPGSAVPWSLLAALAREAGHADASRQHARRANAIDPGDDVAATLLVEDAAARLAFGEAIAIATACLALTPDAWGVRLARVFPLLAAGEARAAHEDALAAAHAAPHAVAAWQNVAMTSLYLDDAAEATLSCHQWVSEHLPPVRKAPASPSSTPRAAWRPGTRPLHVGLVSPDLRRHPVGELVAPLLLAGEPGRLRWTVYADGAPDALTAKLRPAVDAWRDVRGWRDEDVAAAVRADRIDVLVDLAGHSAGGRPRLFSARCAPLQVGYLGYLHPTGLAAMDAVVGDRWTLPGAGGGGAEAPLRLAGPLWAFVPSSDVPPVPARRPGAVRFGSFNHLAKLSPATVSLWARVLSACPGSSLTLCAIGLADTDVRTRVLRRFIAAGVDPTRVVLLPPEFDAARFLARHDEIDVALDPLPFNGGMTTLQALWQGVPVLTWPGERMAARIGASMLASIGLPEFIARDADDYVGIAAKFAAAPDALRDIRAGLRDRLRGSPLLDAAAFAAGFADALEAAMPPAGVRDTTP